MATPLGIRINALQTDVYQQRELNRTLMAQIEKQQVILDIQFRRIADIQAELDLLKATVRRAAPTFAALLIGPQPARASVASGLSVSFASAPAI